LLQGIVAAWYRRYVKARREGAARRVAFARSALRESEAGPPFEYGQARQGRWYSPTPEPSKQRARQAAPCAPAFARRGPPIRQVGGAAGRKRYMQGELVAGNSGGVLA